MPGPLDGFTVLDVTVMGPGPFAGMLLGDLGADVIRVERPGDIDYLDDPQVYVPHRNRRSIGLDIRTSAGRDILLRLVEHADCLLEGNRPGVMERNSVGPDECLARNPRLVYARMTGYGQDGPSAQRAGHDINYIAAAGALGTFARRGQLPVPPTNLVGDFGGGGMVLAFGVVSALLERTRSGQGQVIDASMVDGVAALMASTWGMRAAGTWRDEPGTNVLDTGAPFYDVYRTADGGQLAVGAIERKFYDAFVSVLGLPDDIPDRDDPAVWPELKKLFADRLAERTRDEWMALFEQVDACVSPVLSLAEAATDAHNSARGVYPTVAGVVQPAPVPRFSRTPGSIRRPPMRPGADTVGVLTELGLDAAARQALFDSGVVH